MLPSILHLKIHKINISNSTVAIIENPTLENIQFDEYVDSIISIVSSSEDGTNFKMRSEGTEVISSVIDIVLNSQLDKIDDIVNRLLLKEVDAQAAIDRLAGEIQPGIVIQASLIQDNVRKYIICKAEDAAFINEEDYQIARGYPIKKKIIKSCICVFDENSVISQIKITDTNNNLARYWWDHFLEVDRQWDDSYNTTTAFNSIDKLLSKYKKKAPSDYYNLRNSTIKYFRTNADFKLEDFLETYIGDYQPEVPEIVNVSQLKSGIRNLPEQKKFDSRFGLIPSKITARIKSTINLTEEIELVIKKDIDIENTIKAYLGSDNQKYIKIRTDEGYDAFVRTKDNTGDSNN